MPLTKMFVAWVISKHFHIKRDIAVALGFITDKEFERCVTNHIFIACGRHGVFRLDVDHPDVLGIMNDVNTILCVCDHKSMRANRTVTNKRSLHNEGKTQNSITFSQFQQTMIDHLLTVDHPCSVGDLLHYLKKKSGNNASLNHRSVKAMLHDSDQTLQIERGRWAVLSNIGFDITFDFIGKLDDDRMHRNKRLLIFDLRNSRKRTRFHNIQSKAEHFVASCEDGALFDDILTHLCFGKSGVNYVYAALMQSNQCFFDAECARWVHR